MEKLTIKEARKIIEEDRKINVQLYEENERLKKKIAELKKDNYALSASYIDENEYTWLEYWHNEFSFALKLIRKELKIDIGQGGFALETAEEVLLRAKII